MQKAILSSLFHVASSESEGDHWRYCPKSTNSWCQYQSDTINGTNLYTPGPGISSDVVNAINPVYADLTRAEILKNVFMAVRKTQLKALIQSYGEGPKTVYCGLDTLELAMYDAVANNNYGRKATLDIYEQLIMIPGEFTSRMCNVLNVRRKYNVAPHNTPVTKKRRKVLRGEKKK